MCPFDSNGNASLVPGYLAVDGQTILPSQHNPPLEDIANMLSQVVLRSGVAPIGGNLSMGGFKVVNAAPGAGDNDYVTMAQLNAVIASVSAARMPTGAVVGFRATSAPSGWVKENGGTIGSASSGATTRANADTQPLFEYLWNQFNNTALPVYDSSGTPTARGASAAADFAANRRLQLFNSRSRFHRGADDGLGYDTSLIVGAFQDDAIKSHTVAISDPGHGHLWSNFAKVTQLSLGTAGSYAATSPNPNGEISTASSTTGITASYTGDVETRPRSSVVLYCIKL